MSLYIGDLQGGCRIRRVGPDGIITTVAGNGACGFSGDGDLATQASIVPFGLAAGPDGSLYIADISNNRIRRVGQDGIITTVAGTGAVCFFNRLDPNSCGEGGPATQAQISEPTAVAVGPDGALYIMGVAGPAVRRVGLDGIITTVAGNGSRCIYSETETCGDGGPASQAGFDTPFAITVGSDGILYVADSNRSSIGFTRIRRVSPDGIITTIAGGGPECGLFLCGDGGPATHARLGESLGVAVGPDGNLYISSQLNSVGVVLRVAPALPTFSLSDFAVPSADGSELYQFDFTGRHLRTLNTLTGAVLYQFSYDASGRLTQIRDGDNNLTTIERNASGNPIAIVSPFGQRTALALDANGFLASITNPANETMQFGYTADGLLTSRTDPKGNVAQMTYDALGRLTRDADAAGGSQNLARTETTNGYQVTRTTGLGRTTQYQIETLPIGTQRLTNTFPDGSQSQLLIGTDGSRITTVPDSTVFNLLEGPDPRFSMMAPLPTSQTVKTPSGLTSITTTARTVNLTDPNNLFSLTDLTDTVVINGRTFTSSYDAATKTFTDTSATGRQSTSTIDTLGRLVRREITGLLPIDLSYDGRGHLAGITQGAGAETRTTGFSYNGNGFLQSITDPLERSVGFAYDAAGRVTTQTLPDGRQIQYTYDANGNLISLTPPGRPAHEFAYTPVDLNSQYTPPDVGIGTTQTVYTYNVDRQLTQVTRPDGKTVVPVHGGRKNVVQNDS